MDDPGPQNISKAVGEVAKLQPEIRLARSISEFSEILKGDMHKHAHFKNLQTQTPPSAVEVVRLTEEINRDGARRHKSWRPHGTRLIMILERIRQFAPVGDVLIGGAQNMLASGVWAVVRMALEISLRFLSYFEKVSALLLKVGRSLSIHQDFAVLLPHCRQTQVYMCEYTTVFVDMCKKIIVHARRSLPSQVAASFLSTFDSDFKPFEDNLAEWGRSIEQRATILLLNKATTIQDQSSNLQKFHRLQIKLSKNASKRDVRDRKQRLLNYLCPDQREYDATWRRERRRGTSNWILENPSYQSWRSKVVSDTLWLKGNLGSGKTVTMASIVADLIMAENESEWESQNESQTRRFRTVSHFFCRNSSQAPLHAENILGSLTFQVLNDQALALPLEKFLQTSEDTQHNRMQDVCIDLLLKVTPPNWHGVFVLDGLDEAPLEEIEDLLSLLEMLRAEREVLLCCSSRPNSACNSLAETTIGIDRMLCMEQVDRSKDIRSYIQSQIERWNAIRPLPSKLENLIVEQLLVGCQGMFLWLSLQIEAICPSYNQELQSEAGIFNLLGNLPKDLPEAFDQALLRVPNHQHTARILKLIAAAEPPMSLDELRVAVNVEPGNLNWSLLTPINSGHTLLSKHGSSLLDIDEEDLRVRFIHHSVFLHLARPPALSPAEPFHFDFGDAELLLGEICVTYLNYHVFDREVSTTHLVSFGKVPEVVINSLSHRRSVSAKILSLISRDKRTPTSEVNIDRLAGEMQAYNIGSRDDVHLFLEYATENWLRFTKGFSEGMSRNIYSLWSKLIDGNSHSVLRSLPWSAQSSAEAARWAICNSHGLLFRHQLRVQEEQKISEVLATTLQLAQTCALQEKVSSDEPRVLTDFNLSADQLGLLLPIYLLKTGKHANPKDIKIFVRLGCRPFGTDDSFDSHPTTASSRPTLGLISQSVIPDIFRDEYRDAHGSDSAMVLANYLSHIDLLLENGRTLLHLLIENEYEDAAESLLREHRADPNGGRAPGVPSPLQLCLSPDRGSSTRLRSLALLLVELGADVSANPDGSFPPLFQAIRWGDTHLFKILRERSPDVTSGIRGSKGETALQYVCRNICESIRDNKGFEFASVSSETLLYIVKRLLRDGADVNSKTPAGDSPMLMAVQAGALELMRCLQEFGANPQTTDSNSATLLHHATGLVMQDLVKAGADANAASPEGVTPLMTAAFHDDLYGVETLIRAGADVNCRIRTKDRGQLSTSGTEIFKTSRKCLNKHAREDQLLACTLKVAGNGDSAGHIATSRLRCQTWMTEKITVMREGKLIVIPNYLSLRDSACTNARDILFALINAGMSNEIRQELLQAARQEHTIVSAFPVSKELWIWQSIWQPIKDKLKGGDNLGIE